MFAFRFRVDAASRPHTKTGTNTEIYTHIDFQSQKKNKANASRYTRLGHARHAQGEVSRPVLRTMGKAGIQHYNDGGRNNRVIEINTKGGGNVQRQKFRG